MFRTNNGESQVMRKAEAWQKKQIRGLDKSGNAPGPAEFVPAERTQYRRVGPQRASQQHAIQLDDPEDLRTPSSQRVTPKPIADNEQSGGLRRQSSQRKSPPDDQPDGEQDRDGEDAILDQAYAELPNLSPKQFEEAKTRLVEIVDRRLAAGELDLMPVVSEAELRGYFRSAARTPNLQQRLAALAGCILMAIRSRKADIHTQELHDHASALARVKSFEHAGGGEAIGLSNGYVAPGPAWIAPSSVRAAAAAETRARSEREAIRRLTGAKPLALSTSPNLLNLKRSDGVFPNAVE
jgi:hypothetical protein